MFLKDIYIYYGWSWRLCSKIWCRRHIFTAELSKIIYSPNGTKVQISGLAALLGIFRTSGFGEELFSATYGVSNGIGGFKSNISISEIDVNSEKFINGMNK